MTDAVDIQQLRQHSVLYAEDDRGLSDQLNSYLQQVMGEVYIAHNGLDATRLYEEHRPDILLSDIRMQLKDGVEVAEHIRRSDSRTRIILISAYTSPRYTLKAIELQLTRYLVKPFSEEQLIEALLKAVAELNQFMPGQIDLGMGYSYDSHRKAICAPDGRKQVLRRREAILLEYLLEMRPALAGTEQIHKRLYNGKDVGQSALRTLVRSLRSHLDPDHIENIPGQGYRLVAPAEIDSGP